MVRRHSWHILPMIAKVKDYQVKVIEQVLPVGKVGVRGEAVSMRKKQTHALRPAVTPHANFGAILQRNVKGHPRYGKLEAHEISATHRSEMHSMVGVARYRSLK